MRKQCGICGKTLDIEDWYAFIRRKYCPACAAEMKRMQSRDRMRRVRQLAAEKRMMQDTLCKAQREEIERLRAEIIRLREGA